jgi:hypothetical protein
MKGGTFQLLEDNDIPHARWWKQVTVINRVKTAYHVPLLSHTLVWNESKGSKAKIWELTESSFAVAASPMVSESESALTFDFFR